MKKVFLFFTALSAATVSLISCRQETAEVLPQTGFEVRVLASIQDEEESKTYLGTYDGQDRVVLWGTGEQMMLAVTSGGSTAFASSASADAFDGQPEADFSFTISPSDGPSYRYQGIYPASAAVASDNSDPAGYKVVLPSVQNCTESRYDPAAFIMIAQPSTFQAKETVWKASFRRAVALNKLTIKGIPAGVEIVRVELTSPEGVFLSGGRQMDLSTGASGDVYDGCRSIAVNCSPAVAGGSDIEVWFSSWGAVFAEGSSFTVSASTSDSRSFTKTVTIPSGHPISLKEGWLNTFNVNMAGLEPVKTWFSGGSGTKDDPWRIASVADLESVADLVSSYTDDDLHFRSDFYIQTADIDFAGGTHSSIGNSNASAPYSFFAGSYDGNGFKISNLVISNPIAKKATGFFGYLDGSAHIKALRIENATINATTSWNNGFIAGCVQPSTSVLIEDCSVTASSLTSNDESNGGLVGKFMSGTIWNSSFQGSVKATNSAKNSCGGIVGYCSGTGCVIDGCNLLDASSVTGAGQCVGGIVGKQDGGSVLNCTVSGPETIISGGQYNVGGIIGYVTNNNNVRRIENCSVDCKEIKGKQGLVGGLIGDIETPGLINRCMVRADVTSDTSGSDSGDKGGVGGLIGQIYNNQKNLVIANCCYGGGSVSATNSVKGNVGGLIGNANIKVMNFVTVLNCCAIPDKVESGSSNQNIAGIAGYASDIIMLNCFSPTPYTYYRFNGAVINPVSNQSNGALYGWLRNGNEANGSLCAIIHDAYWISGFKAGRSNGNFTYDRKEQELSDSQMRNTGAVTRPGDGVSYPSFIEALDAAASEWNANPAQNVNAASWEIGPSGYPEPTGPDAAVAGVKTKVSILGDSISTYQGFTPYPSNYQYPKGSYTDFTSVSQTWWHQIIYDKMTGAKLEVNSSYTGTCVQETTEKGHPGYGFLHRYAELGDPDVILINGGTNDSWSYSLPVGTLDFSIATDNLDEYQFAQAYDKLIRLTKAKYPSAKIACIIGDNVMDAANTAYAQVIRDVCEHYDLPYAQVVFPDRAAMTYDNVHPNVDGMEEMASQIWNALKPVLEPGSEEIPTLEARIVNVDSPRMKVYLPPTKGKLCPLVIACPGGGYSSIPGADGYEGAYWKDLFNDAGYAFAVLYYTMPGGDSGKPTADMEEALRLVRRRAGKWYVNTDRVGVMGFSAGGHLASWAATNLSGNAKADFQILMYPVITMGEGTHTGSRTQLLGGSPTSEQIAIFSNEQHVSASTPRAFIAYADNDTTVPPTFNGAAYYDALSEAGIPVERHIYSNVTKPHGWHWGTFTFNGITQNDGTAFEHLDNLKASLSTWLTSF